MVGQDGQRLQHHPLVSGPAVQGMDHHHIKLALAGVLEKLAEDRAFSDGVGMSGAALFPVDLEGSPTLGLAVLQEQPFLSVQGVTLYLRKVGDPDVSYRPHGSTSPPSWSLTSLREAMARATSASVSRKCSSCICSSSSLPPTLSVVAGQCIRWGIGVNPFFPPLSLFVRGFLAMARPPRPGHPWR